MISRTPMSHTRTCSRCKETKDLEDFSIRHGEPSHVCFSCRKEYSKSYYARRGEVIRRSLAKSRSASRDRHKKEMQRTKVTLISQRIPLPKGNSKVLGDLSEISVTKALLYLGKKVLRPVGDNCRYDLVVDEGEGHFSRIQVKTGRIKNNVLIFATKSVYRDGSTQSYIGQCEYFGVYSPEIDKVYLVPVEGAPSGEMSLRLDISKVISSSSIKWAKDFEIGGIAQQ